MRYGPTNKQIDIPQPVLDALAEGKLAIFAGSGVSRDAPSEYPDFVGLAKEAKNYFGSADESYEPVDQYFGRLDRSHPNRVHEWVKQRLSKSGSHPNLHHTTLLNLFRQPDQVRIVTTNFDHHFSTAALKRFGDKGNIEEFHAPALSVGSHFSGLVYLHGKVTGPADRLVLTDYDFGRAYLSEGWACRFLIDLFRTYTVLFVGYSGADTIVQYLARGLSPEEGRAYAFAGGKDDTGHWETLHVKPITYLTSDDERDHSGLWQPLESLAEHINRNALDDERMTRLLLAQPPPSAGIPDNDYLSKVFLHAQKIAYFLRYGKAWHWVEWTDREGLITAAFDVYSAEDEHLRQICFWLARQMVAAADEAAMRLLIKYGQECSACLRNFLLREIGYNGDIRNPYIRAWAAQLLEDSPPDDKDDLLEMLSLVSRLPPSISSDFCLVLARHLAKPRLVAKLWSYAGPERVECEVVYAERPECLETLWENVLKPHIKHYAAPVLSIIAESFASCRQFWCLSRTDVAAWDDLTISRRDVACASPHLCPQTFHALIDIALACLAWMQENDAELASAFIRIWLGSEAPLLRRLAVHGLSQEEVKAPDQMLDHILAKQWLKDGATTQELTRLIVRAYRSASEGARTRFLAGAALCFGGETLHDETLEQHVAWRMFNLLDSILRGMTPPCSVASARLEDVLARHPDWRNMPMTSGGSVEICSISSIPSPISIAELLARSPAEHLEFLITFKDGDVFKGEPTRGNLCAALSKAIEQQPTWGLQLGELLVARDADAPTDIWHALMQGLSDAPLEDGQWPEVYALVSSSAYPAAMLYDGGHFLLRRIEGKKHQIPDTCLADIGGIYSHLWNKSDQEREPECRTGEEAHWAGQAYKHISGLAVRCSLALALRERGCAPDAWRGLSSGTGDFLSRVIADHHARGTYGRVMLAIMLAHLFYLDPEWTRERIVPLLDWDDQPEAERLWEAHGTNGRVFSDVAQDMLPLYAGTINGWEGLQPAARNGLAEKYVLMLCRGRFPDNERRDLALRVGRCGEPNTKAAFAMMIGEMLRHADRDAKLANWNAWAMPYLSARVADSEQPPRDEELKQMVGWLADVPDFTEYVLTITKSNGRINENVGHHLFRFKKANILKTFPDETLGFLGWLINRVRVKTESLHSFDEMAAQLVSMDKPPAGLENLLNLLCERGSSAALGLEDQLRQKRVKQEAP